MAVVMVAAALGVVFQRNVFRAALTLILCFIAVAGIYITLSADFLAAVQILVYVGAISVLIILAIMMTKNFKDGDRANKMELPVAIVAAVILGVLVYAVTQSPWKISRGITSLPHDGAAGQCPVQPERLYPAGGDRGGNAFGGHHRGDHYYEGQIK